ncbi:hypothetical protein D3C76_606420 [compost metagenome]
MSNLYFNLNLEKMDFNSGDMTSGFMYDSRSWLDKDKTTAREDTIKEKQKSINILRRIIK